MTDDNLLIGTIFFFSDNEDILKFSSKCILPYPLKTTSSKIFNEESYRRERHFESDILDFILLILYCILYNHLDFNHARWFQEWFYT